MSSIPEKHLLHEDALEAVQAPKAFKDLRQAPVVAYPHGPRRPRPICGGCGGDNLGDHGIPDFTCEAARLLRGLGQSKTGYGESGQGEDLLRGGLENPSVAAGLLDDPEDVGMGFYHGLFLLECLNHKHRTFDGGRYGGAV